MSDFLYGEFGQRFAESSNPWDEIAALHESGVEMPVNVLELIKQPPLRLSINESELINRGGLIAEGLSVVVDAFPCWIETNLKYHLLYNDREALRDFCEAALLPDHAVKTLRIDGVLCFVSEAVPKTFKAALMRRAPKSDPNSAKTVYVRECFVGKRGAKESEAVSSVATETIYADAFGLVEPELEEGVETGLSLVPVASVVSTNLRDYFPYPEPREGQIETCLEIVDAFERGYTDVVYEGPCGSGKSVLAMTVLRFLTATKKANAFIATPLKTLQNQYAGDMAFADHMRVVKGMSAYRCSVSGSMSPACSSKGSSERRKMRGSCKSRGVCAYYNAIEEAQRSNIVLHNMASLIYQCAPYSNYFSERDYLCLDEAHVSEDSLLELFSFSISQKLLTKYDTKGRVPWLKWHSPYDKPCFDEVNGWLLDVKQVLAAYLRDNKENLKESDEKALERVIDNIKLYEDDMDKWVCSMDKEDAYVFKPLDISHYAKMITGKGDRRLWMSATILGVDNFAKSLGLDPKKCYFMSTPSTFPKQNRPIYACEQYGIKSLNAREIDKNLPKLIDAVDDIIDNYPVEKGLIHTHTYKILHTLVNNSKHKHRFIFHDATNREEVLGEFIRSPDPLILVSPSMVEGVDMKDDRSRFQILCKIPWPYLGDAQIAGLKDLRAGWYVWKCALDVVQACGRIVRHEKDWGDTYVVDPDFRRWRETAWGILPKYFKESIVFVKE